MRRVAPRRLVLLLPMLAVGVGGSIGPGIADARSCLSSDVPALTEHIGLWLSGLPEEASPAHPFYFVAEDAGPGRFEVLGGAHVCNEAASVRYATTAGTASRSIDYDRRAGTAEFLIVHVADPWVVDVPIHVDGSPEAPLESFRVILSHPQNGRLRAPSDAPFYIVDVDGTDRATLDGVPYAPEEFEGLVEVAVFRAGPAEGTLTIPFLVEPSGAFPATSGEDFVVASSDPISFGPGERLKVIPIGIVDDGVPEPDETLTVSLAGASSDAVAETIVTIGGEVDVTPPSSRFHHPRDGWTYVSNDYRIREIHVFTKDGDGSGVVRISLALRRNSVGGACAWWDGSGFERGACSEPRWLRMRAYEPGWFYYYRLDPLRPSVGTNIRSYTALAFGEDAAGNLEVATSEGRHRNTFEVRKE